MSKQQDRWTLCATELQAREWRAAFAREQQALGRQAWEAPQIVSVPRWLRNTWLRSWPTEILLSRTQERWLWWTLLQQDPLAESVLAPQALAAQFAQTWALCHDWQIDPGAAPAWTAEQTLYARVQQRFARELRERGWITSAQLAAHVLQAQDHPVDTAPLWRGPPAALCSPRDRQLRAALQVIPVDSAEQSPGTPQGVLCADPSAQWAYISERLLRILDSDPKARIVVAVADLAAQTAWIDVVWRPLLAEWSCRPGAERDALPWRVEAPQPLAAQPAVAALRGLSALTAQGNSYATLRQVLGQSLWFSAEERPWIARADRRLRERGVVFACRDLLAALPDDAPTTLIQRLQALTTCVENAPRLASGADWLLHWQQRWACMPLPAASTHGQLQDTLDAAMLGFRSLTDAMSAMNAAGAVYWWDQVLQDHHLSPPSAVDSPILVCDLNQAAGLPCSHLLMANLDQGHWPGARTVQPWINPELLREAGWPQATPSRWLQWQQQHWQSLLGGVPHCECVLSQQDAQGTPQAPPPALGLAWQAAPVPPPRTPLALQERSDDSVAPLSAQRLADTRGGSTLVRRLARSPFIGFVHHRLAARELPAVPIGLSAARQGEWIHAVLAAFWAQVQDSHTLATLDDAALDAHLQTCIRQTQAQYVPWERYGEALVAMESGRVWRACRRWIGHERRRDDPYTVLYREVPVQLVWDGLPLQLRLDRVDRVHTDAGEKYLLIDYKTGQISRQGWAADSLLEPQLPLYASAKAIRELDVPQIDGICLARVDENMPGLVAATNWCERLISTGDAVETTWKGDWQRELAGWQARLDELLRQYREGDIRHARRPQLERDRSVAAAMFLLDAEDAADDSVEGAA